MKNIFEKFKSLSTIKKTILILISLSAIVALSETATSQGEIIKFDKTQIQSDADGNYVVSGKAQKGSEILFDKSNVNLEIDSKGNFHKKIEISTPPVNEITNIQVEARYKNKSKKITLEVDNTNYFKDQEEKKAARQQRAKNEAETKLSLVENEPTQTNLDQAKAAILKLPEDDADLNERYEAAEKLVQAKKEETRLLADAKDKVKTAEVNPSNENFSQAQEAINKLSFDNQKDLQRKLDSSKKSFEAAEKEKAAQKKKEEEEKSRLAEEKKAKESAEKEKQKQAATENSTQAPQKFYQSAANPEPTDSGQYLVTSTGTKYHNHKCGNGTYYPATMEVIQSRGLTPCSKCF